MIITSIVPELLNSQEIEIYDVNDVPVSICKKSNFRFNYNSFKNPSILIDVLEKRKYKDFEIKRINLEQLSVFGYRIVSVKTTSKTKNRPRQNRTYCLEYLNKPVPNSEILLSIPLSHLIELDVVNKRVRLKGNNVWPYRRQENATPWIEVEEYR